MKDKWMKKIMGMKSGETKNGTITWCCDNLSGDVKKSRIQYSYLVIRI